MHGQARVRLGAEVYNGRHDGTGSLAGIPEDWQESIVGVDGSLPISPEDSVIICLAHPNDIYE